MAALGLLGVGLLGVVWRFDPREIPIPLCMFHATTGLHCPGCGATRATHELLHGRLVSAIHYNAMWVLSLPLVLYGAFSQARLLLYGRPLPGDPLRKPWFLCAAAVILLVFGVLRNIPVYPLVLLAPPGAG